MDARQIDLQMYQGPGQGQFREGSYSWEFAWSYISAM